MPNAANYKNESENSVIENRAFVNNSFNESFLANPEEPEEEDIMFMFMNMLTDSSATFDNPETSVTFSLPSFDEPTEITGMPTMDIYLSADISDIIFFFKFYDVSPDGESQFIDLDVTPLRIPASDSEDNVNAGVAEDFFESDLFQDLNTFFYETFIEGSYFEKFIAGIPQFGVARKGDLSEPKLYSVDLRALTHYFKKGHTLKLIISTNQSGYVHSRIKGEGFIWHDEDHMSKLRLPVVNAILED